ncbi:MAG: Glycosyltransferase, group 2 family protein [Candidatus Roizmanbacteria bacterium GW2011_GWA2_35_19]|uniref:Glycosyltransferase, group 2 family protein n=2 Tax=Candidatus Roizmaniibacteriota TaxID=1752723 RepID=A0A0G0BJ39_9BACT|nr:MAG: Glycosyltransferase, group 2 family protein [Candidatus Roizmanbacteria bacterium GW2011_GWC2_35_12]KKP69509.1 MAG: Glycosyltransferase, group 2 family protein [Candidatus Roizmanbacteria bacterium GW2011_GWA2_35_19]
MNRKVKIGLLILTWNEIDGITELWPKLPKKLFNEIIAVDPGSTDGTVEYFKKHRIRYIIQKVRGRAEAFRIAFKKTKCDYLLIYSPDGNEDYTDIPRFINEAKKGFDMVIGSRFMKGGANEEDEVLFPARKWANIAFTFIANKLFNKSGIYVTDTINGYRIISKKMFAKLKPDTEGYAIEYQLTIRAFKNNFKIKEIPTKEHQRIGDKSKASSIPTGIKFLQMLYKEIFSQAH